MTIKDIAEYEETDSQLAKNTILKLQNKILHLENEILKLEKIKGYINCIDYPSDKIEEEGYRALMRVQDDLTKIIKEQ